MRLEATNKNVRGGLNKPPPLPGRVKLFSGKVNVPILHKNTSLLWEITKYKMLSGDLNNRNIY